LCNLVHVGQAAAACFPAPTAPTAWVRENRFSMSVHAHTPRIRGVLRSRKLSDASIDHLNQSRLPSSPDDLNFLLRTLQTAAASTPSATATAAAVRATLQNHNQHQTASAHTLWVAWRRCGAIPPPLLFCEQMPRLKRAPQDVKCQQRYYDGWCRACKIRQGCPSCWCMKWSNTIAGDELNEKSSARRRPCPIVRVQTDGNCSGSR